MGYGTRLRELFATNELGEPVDSEVPTDLGRACVKVLAAWQWGAAGRPTAVLTLPSPVRPRLAQSLGRGLAAVGRLMDLGQVSLVEEPRFLPTFCVLTWFRARCWTTCARTAARFCWFRTWWIPAGLIRWWLAR